MNNDLNEYISHLKGDEPQELTREHLITGTVINIKRILLELQELENIILANSHNNTFSIIILGAKLETIKREVIEVKREYQKK